MKKESIKNFIKILTVAVLVIITVTMLAGTIYSEIVFDSISDNVVRLHVIANSDSKEDQMLKLKVRDAVVEYTGKSLKDCDSSSDVINALEDDCENIKRIADECLKNEGSSYSSFVYVGEYDFPSKNYGNYCFPEGRYSALRIVIGEGVGKNWWCVLFPPLCYISENAINVSAAAESSLKDNLSDEAYATIEGEKKDVLSDSDNVKDSSGIDSNVNVSYKFKIVEFFQRIISFFSD